MQQVELPLEATEQYSFESKKQEPSLDPKVFSSILVSCKMQADDQASGSKDPHSRLLELMHSSPVRSILTASERLASEEGITAQEALQQIIMSFKEIDQLWNQVLLKEGLARLSSQYH